MTKSIAAKYIVSKILLDYEYSRPISLKQCYNKIFWESINVANNLFSLHQMTSLYKKSINMYWFGFKKNSVWENILS